MLVLEARFPTGEAPDDMQNQAVCVHQLTSFSKLSKPALQTQIKDLIIKPQKLASKDPEERIKPSKVIEITVMSEETLARMTKRELSLSEERINHEFRSWNVVLQYVQFCSHYGACQDFVNRLIRQFGEALPDQWHEITPDQMDARPTPRLQPIPIKSLAERSNKQVSHTPPKQSIIKHRRGRDKYQRVSTTDDDVEVV
mmetsp:Transcript_36076/g.83714  ORF Transcript_36076/g.83714 Transcript_36076/m.83714 type:complete len:199 (-) Transcript_36076:46-642(-)